MSCTLRKLSRLNLGRATVAFRLAHPTPDMAPKKRQRTSTQQAISSSISLNTARWCALSLFCSDIVSLYTLSRSPSGPCCLNLSPTLCRASVGMCEGLLGRCVQAWTVGGVCAGGGGGWCASVGVCVCGCLCAQCACVDVCLWGVCASGRLRYLYPGRFSISLSPSFSRAAALSISSSR